LICLKAHLNIKEFNMGIYLYKMEVHKMNDLFEFLGFQDAMKQTESNRSMGDEMNDLIMNGNYSNTADLVSDWVDLQLEKDK